MSDRDVSRRSALKYFGLLAASAAGREFFTSWLPVSAVRGDASDDLVSIHDTGHSRADEEATKPYVPQTRRNPYWISGTAATTSRIWWWWTLPA